MWKQCSLLVVLHLVVVAWLFLFSIFAFSCHLLSSLTVLLKNIAATFSSFLSYNSIHFCFATVPMWYFGICLPVGIMIATISITPGQGMKLHSRVGSGVMVTVAQFSRGRLVHTISLGKMNLIRREIDVFVYMYIVCVCSCM